MNNCGVTLVANSTLLGGAERYAIELYRQLNRSGFKTSLLGALPGWMPECGDMSNIGISDKWDGRNIPRILRSVARDHRMLASSLDRISGVAHCQYKREQIQFTRTLARHHPVYWTEHGAFRTSLRARAMQAAYKAAARNSSGIICVSTSVADSVRPVLGRTANITVIPNGVDLDLYKPASEHEKRMARELLGLKPDIPTMLWIGAARQGKLPGLVGATAQLFNGQSLLVGDGPEKAPLVEASRAENISYAGHLENPAVAYAAADVMIFTSTGAGEGAPLVLLEAAACGVPVLSHDGCGVEAMVTNVGGLLVSKKASQLAAAAERAARGGLNAAGVAWAAERSAVEAAKLHAQFMGLSC